MRSEVNTECAQEPIGIEARRTDELCQPTLCQPAVEGHLPQAILRVDKAEREKRVGLTGGVDVRHTAAIARDRHLGAEPSDGERAFVVRLTGLAIPEERPESCHCEQGEQQSEQAQRAHRHSGRAA